MIDLLIHNGILITMNPARDVLRGRSVAVSGGRIVEIGEPDLLKKRHSAARLVDATNMAVLPGLVDLHGHLGGGLMKTVGDAMDGFRWRQMMEFVCSRASDLDWWKVEARINALEHIKFGCTCAYTNLGGNGTRNETAVFIDAVVEELDAIGLRARIGLSPARPPWPRPYSYWENGKRTDRLVEFNEVIDVCDAILTRYRKEPAAIVDFCVGLSRIGNRNAHDPMWDAGREGWVHRQAEALRDLMGKHDVGLWTHVYGNAIEYAEEEKLGLLGPKSILSHCTDINDRSIAIMKETGSHGAHHPRANRIYSYPGRCPVPEMIDAGVNVALGSDGPPPNRTTDIFLDMKAAMRQQRMHFKDPNILPPGKALEMATIDGYRALGLDKDLGSVEVGKKADLITVDLAQPHLAPANMPVHRVVYQAVGRDVSDVIVDGRLVMERRKVLTIDEKLALAEAEEMGRRTIEWMGLQPFTKIPSNFWGCAR